MKYKQFFIGVQILLLSACATSLSTYQVGKSGYPIKGIVYFLPKTKISYNAKYKLKECTAENILLETKLESVSLQQTRDETTTYVLDYTDLASASKDTDLDVTFYETGVIKSINATTDDKSAEIIGGVVNTVATLAMANIPAALPLAPLVKDRGPKPEEKEICRQEVRDAITAEPKLEKGLEEAKKSLEATIKNIKKAREVADIDLGKLEKLLLRFDTNLSDFRDAESKYKSNQEMISFTQTFSKDDTYSTEKVVDGKKLHIREYVLTPEPESIKKWLDPSNDNSEENFSSIKKSAEIFVTVNPDDVMNIDAGKGKATPQKGILYRIPVMGSIAVRHVATGEVLHNKRYLLSGLGRMAYLPYSNGMFQENTLIAEFSETGTLTHVNYKTNAPAERVATLLESVAGKVAEYKDAKRQKPLTDLQSQIEYQKAINEYKTLTKDTNEELEQLKLEYDLRELSGKMDSLTNEELERELARIKLEAEIQKIKHSE